MPRNMNEIMHFAVVLFTGWIYHLLFRLQMEYHDTTFHIALFTLRIGIQDYSSIFIMVALKVKGKLSCYQIQALSTRISFHMKTQLFLYGYGFRPRVSDENENGNGNAGDTLSVPIYSAQYQKLIQDGGRTLPFLAFYTWAYF